jgi:hypothetical protein
LAINGGDVSIKTGTARLTVNKFEKTISVFTGLPDFGRFYHYIKDDEEVQITSTSFVSRFTAQTDYLPRGSYKLTMYFEWDMSDSGVSFFSQILLDETTEIDTYSMSPLITGNFQKVSIFRKLEFTTGSGHEIKLNVKVAQSTRSVSIRNVRMEIFTV